MAATIEDFGSGTNGVGYSGVLTDLGDGGVFSNAYSAVGSLSCEFTTSLSTAFLYQGGASTQAAATFALLFPTLPGTELELFTFYSGGKIATLRITASNELKVVNDLGQLVGSVSSPITAGEWYWIQGYAEVGTGPTDGTLQYTAYSNDASRTQFWSAGSTSENTGTTAFDSIRGGLIQTSSTVLYLDYWAAEFGTLTPTAIPAAPVVGVEKPLVYTFQGGDPTDWNNWI